MSKPSIATILTELALAVPGIELFRSPDADPIFGIPMGTHVETGPLRGRPFKRWLARLYYEQEGAAPSGFTSIVKQQKFA